MPDVILTALISFVGTNVDDLFVLMLLFAGAERKSEKLGILCGRYIAIAVVLAISIGGALGLGLLPDRHMGLLGLIPILLGIREWIVSRSSKSQTPSGDVTPQRAGVGVLGATFITLANSADNVGVYIPLFTGYSRLELAVFAAIFAVMTALWCLLGAKLVDFPRVKAFLQRHRQVLVPVIYILLGVYILLKGYVG